MQATIGEPLAKVAAVLQQSDRFLLVGHVDPDPDCVGSLLALDWALRKMGKTSTPVTPDPLPSTCRFLPGSERIMLPQQVNPAAYQVLVVLDCELSRTGLVANWASQFAQVVNIDHHVTNPASAPVLLLDSQAAATGEIIYRIIHSLQLTPDAEAATLLYAAIMGDTGSFRFSNTTAEVLQIGSNLVALGANPDVIARHIYETHSWGYLQLLQRVLATLERSTDGKAAWITITAEMLAQEGVRRDETEGLVQYPRMIDGVEVALVFREVGPAEVRVGFRSRTLVDVSSLAREMGGGGHPRAAGCTLHMSLMAARNYVLPKVQAAVAAVECSDTLH